MPDAVSVPADPCFPLHFQTPPAPEPSKSRGDSINCTLHSRALLSSLLSPLPSPKATSPQHKTNPPLSPLRVFLRVSAPPRQASPSHVQNEPTSNPLSLLRVFLRVSAPPRRGFSLARTKQTHQQSSQSSPRFSPCLCASASRLSLEHTKRTHQPSSQSSPRFSPCLCASASRFPPRALCPRLILKSGGEECIR